MQMICIFVYFGLLVLSPLMLIFIRFISLNCNIWYLAKLRAYYFLNLCIYFLCSNGMICTLFHIRWYNQKRCRFQWGLLWLTWFGILLSVGQTSTSVWVCGISWPSILRVHLPSIVTRNIMVIILCIASISHTPLTNSTVTVILWLAWIKPY